MNRLARIVLLLGCVIASPAVAQFGAFGRNKVQYRSFDWQVVHGAHVDLYFYSSEAELAPVALAYAEESYDALSLKFGHTVAARIPLIVYASHTDFEQTNILPFTPPEGLLGVTDFLKRRVTLPFRGNLAEFRHTMRHELVHVFQISLLLDRYDRSPRAVQIGFPLWWSEGLAEYWSAGEDARDEMILRDLVLSGRLPRLQDLDYVVGGIVYPLGGRIHRWLGETYGDWRAAQMYHDAWRYENFESAVEGVYGRSLEQLNEEFQLAMRRAYYPTSASRSPLTVLAREVASVAIKPAYMPGVNGPEVAYLSPANGYVTIFRRPLDGGRAEALATAGRSAALESFHPFDSRVDASRPGLLLFTTKFNERDALVIWDVKRNRMVGRYQYPDLASVLSPVWGPDGKSVIFSGLSERGISDLYRLDLGTDSLTHLTDDRYQDLDPSLSPDGQSLVFASDRTPDGLAGAVNLFVLRLGSGEIRQLTYGHWVDETPRWGPDGRIYFGSDRDGVLNIFSVDSQGQGRRETSAWTGAYDPEVVPGRDGILVGGFHDLSINIYYYPTDSAARADTFSLAPPPPDSVWTWPVTGPATLASRASQPYHRRYHLDFAAGEAIFIPRLGGAQGVTLFLSDLLSDDLIFLNVASYQGRRFGSIFENVNLFGIYINQTHRLNWGLGVFRSKGNNFEGDFTVAYQESAIGGLGLVRYPLSPYTRLEGQMVVEHSDRTDFTLPVAEPRRVGWLASHYLSYIHDNSLWESSGPIDGGRFSVTAGITSDFSNARFDSFLLNADWRHYLRLGRYSAYAIRGVGWYSGGDRPQRINIGGTWGLRGYPLYGYIVGSKAYMLNQEVRLPLLRYFTLGFPVGDLRFPEVQGAVFFDVGKAWFFSGEHRAVLGSYGLSFRWPLVPGAVLRLDWGRRFSDNHFQGYNLTSDPKRKGFLSFFFGYNY